MSKLSIEMIENFNPCFVLELTATPKKSSNIISIVDARKLKKEQMVKLPVIVYNQKNQEDVFLSAIALRRRLEEAAKNAEECGGNYIRPIVLLQAQPRTNEDATTYEKIKKSLLDIGISAEHIAIKTGEKDEIKDINLLSRDCKIRYIITVNALKEGWDCPFAYILATVANRSSVVDVEQILGRILRMPYAKAGKNDYLNISYAITSSADFYSTLDKVVSGLVNAGFSRRDHRIAGGDAEPSVEIGSDNEQMEFSVSIGGEIGTEKTNMELQEINAEEIRRKLEKIGLERSAIETLEDISNGTEVSFVDDMMSAAQEQSRMYWEQVSGKDRETSIDIPYEVEDKMKTYSIKPEFRDEVRKMVIPQFMRDDGIAYFNETGHVYLDREDQREGFTLNDKDTMIDFGNIHAEMAKIDLDKGEDAVPRAFRLLGFENEAMKKWFEAKPSESRRRICKDIIVKRISKINAVSDAEIRSYVDRVIANMPADILSDMEQFPELYAKHIRKKVESLLEEYEAKTFRLWMQQDRIVCEPNFHFHERISPSKCISTIPKSLYEEEDGNLNDYERQVIWEVSSLDNVRWWHRNISRREFSINGAVTAYPDFIVHLESGKTLLIETKGDHLINPVSEAKSRTGAEWASTAGRLYKYFMIFQTKRPGYPGSCSYEEFMKIIKGL